MYLSRRSRLCISETCYDVKMGETKEIQIKEQMEKQIQQQFLEEYKGLSMQKELDEDFKKLLQEPTVPHLRERTVGKFKIKIDIVPALKIMTVVSTRNWLLMGYKQLECSFIYPRLVYQLFNEKRMLMSDSPQEMFLQYEAYQQAKGRVLCGGLGLGMSPTLFAEKEEVTEVIVVEIEKDIIKLCKPKNKKIKVINKDIWKFLKKTKEKFDYIYIDIHYSTGCMEYLDTVLPMREILKDRFPDTQSSFWGEEEMKSQYDPSFEKNIHKGQIGK